MNFKDTKGTVMHVGKANLYFQYEMNNHCLATTKEKKDLGLMITNNL